MLPEEMGIASGSLFERWAYQKSVIRASSVITLFPRLAGLIRGHFAATVFGDIRVCILSTIKYIPRFNGRARVAAAGRYRSPEPTLLDQLIFSRKGSGLVG